MDVIFEPQVGPRFSIEIGFFDTVREIKEKIQKYHGIPVAHQTLVFNSQVLQDERNVEYCKILQNSCIQLIVKPELYTDKDIPPSPKKEIRLSIKMPSPYTEFTLDANVNDTIFRVKEKIHEVDRSIPINNFLLRSSGRELLDNLALGEYKLFDNADIEVVVRGNAAQVTPGVAVATSNKKPKMMVLTKSGTKKVPVEVNPGDNVRELRKELQRLDNFTLPQEGYFFIYRQNVMDEDRSFRWHEVGQGETIEIFNGSVSGGN